MSQSDQEIYSHAKRDLLSFQIFFSPKMDKEERDKFLKGLREWLRNRNIPVQRVDNFGNKVTKKE